MKHDFELLLIVILVGIIAIIAILGGSYDLLIEKKRKGSSKFHGAVAMLLFGLPSLMAVLSYVSGRFNFLREFITENGYVFLFSSFCAVALLASDVYVLINKKKIENNNLINLAKHGLFLSVIFFIANIILWVRTPDKSTLFLFLK